jgi:opacity protein-like surface antigen
VIKYWLAGIPIAASVGIGSLQAADLRLSKPSAPPPWSWTGLYGGLHSGFGFGTAKFSNPYSDFGSTIYGNDVSTPAALIGGQIGYNYQLGRWVAGIEADAAWLSSDGTRSCFAVSGSFLSSTCHVQPNFLGTLTGRLGLATGPEGRTLLFGKAGLAVIQNDITVTRNHGGANPQAGPPDPNVPAAQTPILPGSLENSTSQVRAGWTVGAGLEQAVTPAWSWKVEYDYQHFSGMGVSTPETANFVGFDAQRATLGVLVPGTTATVQQHFHTFKVGVNYKFGVDPWASWDSPVTSKLYPLHAAPSLPAFGPGWQFEGGARYWYSIGRLRIDVGQVPSAGQPMDSNVSRLTYGNMETHSGELVGRLDSPYMFVKGFLGGGGTTSGNMHDEDWFVFNTTSGSGLYSNTNSPAVSGGIKYGTIDFGYDWLRGPDFKSGIFVGYNYFEQNPTAWGCVQLAAPLVCSGADQRPTNIIGIAQSNTWHSLRIGAGGEIFIGPVRLSAEAAYLPYVRFQGEDYHFAPSGQLDRPFSEWGHGSGAQFEAFATYNITPRFSVGLGGRYWAMWTTSAKSTENSNNLPPQEHQNHKFATEQAGLLFQASYKFGVTAPTLE